MQNLIKKQNISYKGVTKITTSEKYIIEGSDIIYNKNKNLLYSN